MLKKYRFIVALLIIGLVTSGFGQTVGASANDGSEQKETYKVVYQGKIDISQLENFLSQCLAKWNITWKEQAGDKGKKQQVEEQDKKEEQPTNEVEQPTEKVEQPVEKVEQPAPVQPQPQQPAEENNNGQNNQQEQLGQLNQYEQQVVELTNQERAKHGLQPLEIDYELSRVAREKSRDMAINNYFDHNSPVYGSPFDMMRSYGINYRTAGENIAKGQRTPQEVVNAWMNSPGHRANILSADYTHIGVGYVEQGNHWTQQFIGK